MVALTPRQIMLLEMALHGYRTSAANLASLGGTRAWVWADQVKEWEELIDLLIPADKNNE